MYDENNSGAIRRMAETNRKRRGHGFLPSDAELAKVPGAYATDNIDAPSKTIHLHYFISGADWWLAEVWQEDAESEAEPPLWMGFGYARFDSNPDGAEWGYVCLNELEELCFTPKPNPTDPVLTLLTEMGIAIPVPLVVERDLNWIPKLAHQCIPDIPAPADAKGASSDA